MKNRLTMVIMGLVVVVAVACAVSQPVGEGDALKNRADLVAALDQDLVAAKADDVDALASDLFEKAQDTYLKARDALDKGARLDAIDGHLAKSRQYLNQALAVAKEARTIISQTNEAREKALVAGARDLEQPFQEIEKQYLELIDAIENDNIGYARDNAPKIQQGFRVLEIMAIKRNALDPVRRLMAQAQQQGIDGVTPQAYSQARDRLTAAEQFIDQNPYAQQAIDGQAAQAMFMAQRMMAVANSCKRFQAMSPEESALFAEEQIGIFGRALHAEDVRNLELADQVSTLAKAAQQLLAANQASADLNQSYQAQIAAMEQRIAGLQGFSRQQEATTARLAAEREFNKRFDQVQHYFSSDEAEVYKQGNQLVIRMRGIKFPVGQATLSPENYHLLSKVQRAIHTFNSGSIVIEGHTDSTGSAQLNQQLSQQRAEAVKAYLSANDPDIADRIKASGYGADRPLASNNTAEGRAVNRRIDVRITPEQAY